MTEQVQGGCCYCPCKGCSTASCFSQELLEGWNCLSGTSGTLWTGTRLGPHSKRLLSRELCPGWPICRGGQKPGHRPQGPGGAWWGHGWVRARVARPGVAWDGGSSESHPEAPGFSPNWTLCPVRTRRLPVPTVPRKIPFLSNSC